MTERSLTIRYPGELLRALGQSPQEFEAEARVILAAKLFDLGRLSSGHAAKLAGMGRIDFLFTLEKYDVPAINLDPEELEAELEAACEIADQEGPDPPTDDQFQTEGEEA